MPPPRAPLFWVSVAFAIGCGIGLGSGPGAPGAIVLFGCALLGWLLVRTRPVASLICFYATVGLGGMAHTLILATSIATDDLRRLPEAKSYPTAQWRGTVVAEPVAQLTTHTPRRALDRTTFVFRVDYWRPTKGRYFSANIDLPWQPASGDTNCTLLGPPDGLRCGDRLETAMALDAIPAPLTPGAFDERTYLAERSIYFRAAIAPQNWRVITPSGYFWQNLSYRARDWAYDRLQIGLEDDPRIADFLAGMLIGYRQEIPADIEQDFRRTGTLHVFAVSGQNVAELMVVAIVLLQLFGFVRWRWAWITAPLVLLYCLLTGSPASAVRATVMILAVVVAWRLGRPLNALGCWSLALLGMLIWNPQILTDPGAQLSFGVVLGLIVLGPPVARWLYRPFAPDPFLPRRLLDAAQRREDYLWKRGTQMLGATIAATLVSEPITAVDFHQVTPISVFANLIVVPAAGLITIVGTLAIACSLVTTTWASLLNNANWLFARLLIAFVGYLAHEPGASINVEDARAVGTKLPAFLVAPLQDSACLLVRTSQQTWLFNSGRELVARNVTSRLLQYEGINRLDGFMLLQVSAADNSGAAVIVRDFNPQRLIVPSGRTHSQTEKTLPTLAELTRRPLEYAEQGWKASLGDGVDLEALNPPQKNKGAHADERSLVLHFHTPGGDVLWAGRVDAATQAQLLTTYPNLRASVLIMAPESSPTGDWLTRLGVKCWVQFPARDHRLNTVVTSLTRPPADCKIWPLQQTGSIAIDPQTLSLQPWIQDSQPAP